MAGRKDKNTAALLAFALGGFGAHRFYLGQPGWGLIYIIFAWTFIPSLVAFFEFLNLLFMDPEEFDRRYNGGRTLYAPMAVAMLPPGIQPGQVPHRDVADLAEQIKKLHELRVAGLLTDEEFERQKAKLLDSM
ncbi:MAG: NINE protein [Deltaproteobacteria bacterium]|nr:MAG: NINE protein [Deltaproteobacteria bacterium]